jgi:two-component sensor histidine kinase
MAKKKFRYYEVVLISLVWVLLIASPVFFSEKEAFEWADLLGPMFTIVPLFFIFILNRFVLVPRFLYQKKNLFYLISVLALVAVFSTATYFVTSSMRGEMRRKGPVQEFGDQWRQPVPPDKLNRPLPPFPQQNRGPIPPFANLVVFSFLLVGFDTGLMTIFRLTKSERKRAILEKQNADVQLAFLRNQVSPHFFMNTLNNIHSLIDVDSEEAKDSIIRLSKLMRHLLYDSEIEKIPIRKEIEFVKNYVDLMKLRYSEKVKITLDIPEQLPDKSIPPLLFTSYLENAFKHGISYQHSSFIDIRFSIKEDQLIVEIRNSNPHLSKKDEPSGIGVENSRKRLDLIYGENYSLKIEDNKDEYLVSLNIPL